MIGRLVKPNRREFLRVSLPGSGALLLGFDRLSAFAPYRNAGNDPFQGGKQVGVLEFTGETKAPLDTIIGTGLDARLYSDLSALTPDQLVTPAEKSYFRTFASKVLHTRKSWKIKMDGLVQDHLNLTSNQLQKNANPIRTHLMDCS